MSYREIENFLTNFSFYTLIINMFYYWILIAFFSENINDSLIISKTPNLLIKKDKNKYKGLFYKILIGKFLMFLTNLSIALFLVIRWRESGHFPLSNLYESLIFLSWNITVIHLIFENFTNHILLGSITAPLALFINAFACFKLPSELKEANTLVPALNSNWLIMHVTIIMFSYAALFCGSLLALIFLFVTFGKKIDLEENLLEEINFTQNNEFSEYTQDIFNDKIGKKKFVPLNNSVISNTLSSIYNINYSIPSFSEALPKTGFLFKDISLKNFTFIDKKHTTNLAKRLDNLSYRILGIGFPLLTVGILSGAVWANEAWGSYWSWDPKETWALITWIVFAIYFHLRLTKHSKGKNSALIASAGFFSIWICYLGVNFLGKGLHSYGFIN
jgi:cytochrome c-type biogenesis protein CcsB